jgi:hypothetical protein
MTTMINLQIILMLLTLSPSCHSIDMKTQVNAISVSGVKLGGKVGELTKRLGKPTRIEHISPEMDVDPYDNYYYDKSFFEITKNVITGFEINDNKFQLDQGKIKVGDTIDKVKKAFNQLMIKDNQAKIRINTSDDYLLFVFADGKVYSFSIYNES